MTPDLDCVVSFLELSRTRHFRRAAEALHVSPSALTKRLQRLERQVGEPLVERSPAGFSGLTRAGHRFLPIADQLASTAAAVGAAPGGGRGQRPVHLGLPGHPGEYLSLAQWSVVGEGLRAECPQARLRIVGVPYPRREEVLAAGGVDVLIDFGEPGVRGHAIVPLIAATRILVVPAETWDGSVGAAGRPVTTVDDVLARPLLTCSALGRWMEPWVLGDVARRRGRLLRDIDAARRTDVLHASARSGVASVHPGLVRSRLGPGFVAAEIRGAPPVVVWAACSTAALGRPEVTALVTVLRILARALALPRPAPPAPAARAGQRTTRRPVAPRSASAMTWVTKG